MLNWLKNMTMAPQPAGPEKLIHRFDASRQTISGDLIVDADGWRIDAGETQTTRLFELDPGDIDNGMIIYRASIKSESIEGRGYLEMQCRFPGKGEFFSKGLHNALKGSNDWASYEIPFYLKKGQNPDLLKLDFTLEGSGRAWLKDVEVSFTPFK